MPSIGPVNLTHWEDLGGGFAGWSNPANAEASDNAYATCAIASDYSNALKGSQRTGAIVPATATIDGIKVEIEASAPSGDIADNYVDLYKNGVVVNHNQATQSNLPATDGYRTYGGAADLWGTTWTAGDVNDLAGFGLVYGVEVIGAGGTARVDHARITIYYTEDTGPRVVVAMAGELGPVSASGGVGPQDSAGALQGAGEGIVADNVEIGGPVGETASGTLPAPVTISGTIGETAEGRLKTS